MAGLCLHLAEILRTLENQEPRQAQEQTHAGHVGRGGQEDAGRGGWIQAQSFQSEGNERARDAADHAAPDHGQEHHHSQKTRGLVRLKQSDSINCHTVSPHSMTEALDSLPANSAAAAASEDSAPEPSFE